MLASFHIGLVYNVHIGPKESGIWDHRFIERSVLILLHGTWEGMGLVAKSLYHHLTLMIQASNKVVQTLRIICPIGDVPVRSIKIMFVNS